jgi:hypothetical protein
LQNGTGLRGRTLEGTQFYVDSTSSAASVIEDRGNAAKIEMSNLTLNGSGNPSLTSLFRFGRRAHPLGTYGYLHNLMGRDAPRATAFDFETNIMAVGVLSSIGTRDGVVNQDGGVGLFAQAVYPIGVTRYGQKMSLGDVTTHIEVEAPGPDAVSIFFNRGGTVLSGILSLTASQNVKTLIGYNRTYVSGASLGPISLLRPSGSTFGDAKNPALRGVATEIGPNTLTDTTKNWKLNQWKNSAVFIQSGPGQGNWSIIGSNTHNTLKLLFSSWNSTGNMPVTGCTYALDYPCKSGKEVDGAFVPERSVEDKVTIGHGLSLKGPTYPEALILELISNIIESDTIKIGSHGSSKDQEFYFEVQPGPIIVPAQKIKRQKPITVFGLSTKERWVIDIQLTKEIAHLPVLIDCFIEEDDALGLIYKNFSLSDIEVPAHLIRGCARRFI